MSQPVDERPGESTDLLGLPVLRLYEEARAYPRIDLRNPVTISTPEHEVVTARCRNLSPDGLQVRCRIEAASRLNPTGRQIRREDGRLVVLRTELPTARGDLPFVAVARLVYMTARRRGEFAFGLEFARIQPADRAHLEAFIADAIRPPDP